jgi:SWI/SNF-related matrix-associated actin-dependent regulator of chromatin subfamily A-like protein 1
MSKPKRAALELPHQAEGTRFLRANERGALFDEQGLGKSKQVIDAIAGEIATGTIDAALIVCPNGLKSNWAGEIEKFSEIRYAVFGSGHAARRLAFRSLRAGFYVINYEAVANEMAALKALMRFKRVAIVLDESHRIKTPEARTTRALLALRSFASRRYILSGTPVANTPDDLWSQMLFLDDGEALGATLASFQRDFKKGARGYKNLETLRDRVLAKGLRRTKETSLDLPPKHVKRIPVDLNGRQKELYELMRNELAVWVRGMDGEELERRADAVLARLVRLAQIASHPGLIDTSYDELPAKIAVMDQLLAGYLREEQQKVLLWSSFVGNIGYLMGRYAHWHPVCIHGEVDAAGRDAAVHAFKNDPATRLLIANPAAAREGLTLTEANVAIYVDRTFNLVDYLQSQDRIHRISQTRPCEILVLIGAGTIDELIDYTLDQKARLAKYTQSDLNTIDMSDVERLTPAELRAHLQPAA